MVRTYKRKTTFGASLEVLKLAAEEVISKKQSLKTVALTHGLDKISLLCFCKKAKEVFSTSDYSKHKILFTAAEEQELVNYLLDAVKMFFGLSPKETRKLAYQYAKSLRKIIPCSWHAIQSAGVDWFKGLMKRHENNLSIRTLEATSLSRMTSFNRQMLICFTTI